MSIIRYGAGRLTNCLDIHVTKINSIILKITRHILGIESYKMSTTKILQTLDWLSFPQIIAQESIKIIHKLNIMNKPKALKKYFYFNQERVDVNRNLRKPNLSYKPKAQKLNKSQMYRGVYYYSKLPFDIRILKPKLFNKKLKTHIMNSFNTYHLEKLDT